jgi:hypothetical protein
MSCSCTEDKFLYNQTTKTETPWDGVAKGIIIGRNRVMCQECIDQNAIQEKQRKIHEMASEISALEIKNLRKLYDGEDMTAVNAERAKLRAEIQKLEKPSAV